MYKQESILGSELRHYLVNRVHFYLETDVLLILTCVWASRLKTSLHWQWKPCVIRSLQLMNTCFLENEFINYPSRGGGGFYRLHFDDISQPPSLWSNICEEIATVCLPDSNIMSATMTSFNNANLFFIETVHVIMMVNDHNTIMSKDYHTLNICKVTNKITYCLKRQRSDRASPISLCMSKTNMF